MIIFLIRPIEAHFFKTQVVRRPIEVLFQRPKVVNFRTGVVPLQNLSGSLSNPKWFFIKTQSGLLSQIHCDQLYFKLLFNASYILLTPKHSALPYSIWLVFSSQKPQLWFICKLVVGRVSMFGESKADYYSSVGTKYFGGIMELQSVDVDHTIG